jgi:hypothetical protein
MLDKVKTILEERPGKHGEFAENSRATWEIMRALQHERNWSTMTDQQKHAVYMVAHKLARIVCGDPAEPDHWDDIAGYATLVADRIRKPVVPYDGTDVYSALAVAWHVPRAEAKARVQQIMRAQTGQRTDSANTMAKDLSGRPVSALEVSGRVQTLPKGSDTPQRPQRPGAGTPEDGGQHADASVDALAEELRRQVEADLDNTD